MQELNGIEYLRKKLNQKKQKVDMRYKRYEMKYQDADPSIVIPQHLKGRYKATLGWCSKSVDSLADRLIFRGFENDIFDFAEIFNMNNPDVFYDSAILSSLIASCCFVYISNGEEDVPRLQVIEASNATGTIDPITGLLSEGYAVLERDKSGNPSLEAHFMPGETRYYTNGEITERHTHKCLYPLLVPIVHRPDAVRPFGRSRITRAAVYYQRYAQRTLERADITAEFYSFPQKYAVGLSQNAERLETWKATISTMLQFDKDEDGDHPVLGQFTMPSMSPFTEQFRTAAAGFAGETGLTLDDLGFVSDNPSSSEAIKASHETLRAMARKAQRNFGSGFLNVGYLAACIRDDYPYLRKQFYNVKPKWYPVFEPDVATLSSIGDGAIKLNQAIPGYFDEKKLSDITGM